MNPGEYNPAPVKYKIVIILALNNIIVISIFHIDYFTINHPGGGVP